MRQWIGAGTLALAISVPAFAIPTGTPELNSCHGGQCSWSVVQTHYVMRRNAAGALYRLVVRGGVAPEGSRAIRFNRDSHVVFIFCSRRLPAVIMDLHGGLQVDVLDFVNGPPPVLESSASLYMRICHPGEEWSAPGFARRHGYRADDADREIALSRPEDIFGYAQ